MKSSRRATGRAKKVKSRAPKKKARSARSLESQYQRYFGGEDYKTGAIPDSGTGDAPALFEIRQFTTYGAYEDPI